MKQHPAGERLTSTRRDIGFWGVVAIGVGGMVGGGIFAVLGLAADLARGATPLAFLCSGLVALVTAYSYSKLTVALPSQGGTVVFLDRAFGVDLLTGTINNLLWVSYIVTLSLYTVAFASYLETFFSVGALGHHLIVTAGIVVPTILNLTGPKLISRTETAVVGIKVVILVVVIFFGLRGVDWSRLAPSHWESGLSIIGAGMLIFVAYEGFELIANTAPEVEDFENTLPRAYLFTLLSVIVLYVLIAMVTVGTLSPSKIQQAQDFALAAAAKPTLGKAGFTLVAVAAILATFSAINATLYGSARLAASIAAEDELPGFLQKRVWNQPLIGLLFTAGPAILLANTVDLASISTMGSAGFLIIFAGVNAAGLKLSDSIGCSRALCGTGVLMCLSALAALIWHAYQEQPHSLVYLAGLLLTALTVEALYRGSRSLAASS